MKKNVRRRLSAVVIMMCLMVGLLPQGVNAAQSSHLFALVSYGIITADQADSAEGAVTRGRVADMLVKLMGMEEVSGYEPAVRFSDVPEGSPYYKSVGLLAQLGVLKGDGAGQFRPDEAVTFPEAVKLLTGVLGYDAVASAKGGYPAGYLAVASGIGLLKGVSSDRDAISARNLYEMFGNALDIDIMTESFGTGGFETAEGDTYRQRLEQQKDKNVFRQTGVVTANFYTYLDRPVPSIKRDQVSIDGTLYQVGDTNAAELIGQEIDFYAEEAADGTLTLVNVRPGKNNEVLTITEEEYRSTRGSEIEYEADGAEERAQIAADFLYLSNNELQRRYTHADVKVESGFLTLIDNTGDGAFNVVLRTEFEHVRIRETKENNVYFEDGQLLAGAPTLTVDEADKSVKYIIRDASGEPAELADMKPGMILSAAASEAKDFYEIRLSDETVQGTVTELSEHDGKRELTIDGTAYKTVPGVGHEIKAGDSVEAFLNYAGRIADVEVSRSTNDYAYVAGVEQQGVGGYRLKLVLPGTLTVEYEIDDSDPDNVRKTPFLKGKNTQVRILEVNEKCRVDGRGDVDLGELFRDKQNRIVRFYTNAEGRVSRLELPDRVGTGEKRKYNGYERTFGGFGNGAFATSDATKVLCVPENDDVGREDYFAEIEINNGSQYQATGYDVRKNSVADLVAITMPMNSSSVVDVNENKDKFSIVTRVSDVVNDEGEAVKQLDFLSEGQKKSYLVSDSAMETANNMAVGTAFFYTLNPVGEIGKLKIVKRLLPRPAMTNQGSADTTDGKTLFGRLHYVEYDVLDDITNRFVDRLHIWFDEEGTETYTIDIPKRNPPAIYRIDQRQTVTVGSLDDLVQSSDTCILIRASDSKIRGIVLAEY